MSYHIGASEVREKVPGVVDVTVREVPSDRAGMLQKYLTALGYYGGPVDGLLSSLAKARQKFRAASGMEPLKDNLEPVQDHELKAAMALIEKQQAVAREGLKAANEKVAAASKPQPVVFPSVAANLQNKLAQQQAAKAAAQVHKAPPGVVMPGTNTVGVPGISITVDRAKIPVWVWPVGALVLWKLLK